MFKEKELGQAIEDFDFIELAGPSAFENEDEYFSAVNEARAVAYALGEAAIALDED